MSENRDLHRGGPYQMEIVNERCLQSDTEAAVLSAQWIIQLTSLMAIYIT